jgi:Lrp/AsnC family leucine-responsive transcriptional regulator
VPAVYIIKQFWPMRVVRKIRSSFALKQVRYKTALPLQRAAAPK